MASSSADLTYGEELSMAVDTLDDLCKQLCSAVLPHRDVRLKSSPWSSVDRPSVLHLTRRIREKEERMQELMKRASRQAERAKLIVELEAESARRSDHLRRVHRTLKETETTLVNCIFQANEKLKSIRGAQARPVDIDTIVSSSLDMSRSYCVAAPNDWRPGDPLRPYPTDGDMKRGHAAIAAQTVVDVGHASPFAHLQSPMRPPIPVPPSPMMGTSSQSSPMRAPFPNAAPPPSSQQRLPFPSAAPQTHMGGSPHMMMGGSPHMMMVNSPGVFGQSPMSRPALPFPAASPMPRPHASNPRFPDVSPDNGAL